MLNTGARRSGRGLGPDSVIYVLVFLGSYQYPSSVQINPFRKTPSRCAT